MAALYSLHTDNIHKAVPSQDYLVGVMHPNESRLSEITSEGLQNGSFLMASEQPKLLIDLCISSSGQALSKHKETPGYVKCVLFVLYFSGYGILKNTYWLCNVIISLEYRFRL